MALLQDRGLISALECQPPFPLEINGTKVFTYRADFRYHDHTKGETVVEDVKATTNPKGLDPVFILKRKCVEAEYGINVSIVKG